MYPREPRNKKKASKSSTPSTTFYYTKDIQYLLHEPLLAKFRDHKALSKKIARSLGRGEVGDAARLEKKHAPKLSLDHIIKERYPTFVDALRDLDDALSLLSLFANLPASPTVPPKTIGQCQRLCLEFQHYLIRTHSLRKSFLSIKGIYYQATIQGQDVMWLAPYKFVQRVTGDVDFRIMGTFVDFYTTLLGFVNFRLYNSIGLLYPPKLDVQRDEQGGELGAFSFEAKSLEGPQKLLSVQEECTNGALNGSHEISEETQEKIKAIAEIDPSTELRSADVDEAESDPTTEEVSNETVDTFQAVASDADTLIQPQKSSDEIGNLFAPFTFFLSRETPRQPLEFLLRAFGCKRLDWDAALGSGAFSNNELDPSITHQVVDRPPIFSSDGLENGAMNGGTENNVTTSKGWPTHRMPGRTYVQPQWVWDCVNEKRLLRPDLYAPGETLPPHLSPWVKPSKGQYDPTMSLTEQEVEGEADEAMQTMEAQESADAQALTGDLNGNAVEEIMEDSEGEDIEEEEEMDERDGAGAPISARLGTTEDTHGMDITLADEDEDENDEDSDFDDVLGNGTPKGQGNSHASFAGFGSNSDNESENEAEGSDDGDDSRSLHQRELEAEAAGLPLPATSNGGKPPLKSILKRSSSSNGDNNSSSVEISQQQQRRNDLTKQKKNRDKEAEEELERRKMMLPRKKRKLFEKMSYSKTKTDDESKALRAKRRKIEMQRPQ